MKSVRVIPVSAVLSRVPYGYVFLHMARIRVLHTYTVSTGTSVARSESIFFLSSQSTWVLRGSAGHGQALAACTRVRVRAVQSTHRVVEYG